MNDPKSNTVGIRCGDCEWYLPIDDDRVSPISDDTTGYNISLCSYCKVPTTGFIDVVTNDEEATILAEQRRTYPAERRAK